MVNRRDKQQKGISRRALVIAGGQVALFGVLAGRLYYLQVIERDHYRTLADDNRINLKLLPPIRGRILDRYGVRLADNRENFRIAVVPEQSGGLEQTLDQLEKIIPISAKTRKRVLRDARRNKPFVPVPIVDGLNWQDFSTVNVLSPDIPGLETDVGTRRYYPPGAAVGHLTGYVGRVSGKDLEQDPDPLLGTPGFPIGKAGIERSFDKALRGSAGSAQIEVNAIGREIRELGRSPGQQGQDIILTIDLDLQRKAMQRLEGVSGSVVIMDVINGDIYAMASSPSFDPNAFTGGLSSREWKELISDPYNPLLDKCVAGQFPPGSTFKVVVAQAALEAGIAFNTRYTCNGFSTLGTHRFHCWQAGGHGDVDMRKAMRESCDVWFYEVAQRIGIDRIAAVARKMGMGYVSGLPIPNEKPGLIPTRAWKQAKMGVPWQVGETFIAGIGQGFVLSTPLQIGVMIARTANGERAVSPRLVREVGAPDPEFPPLDLDLDYLKLVRRSLSQVVNHPAGTAFDARLDLGGIEMAGKTGTAQVRRISQAERQDRILKNEELPWAERDHSLFSGFAPKNNPRYAISVVVEHGGSGSAVAAPIARDLLAETLTLDPARKPAMGDEDEEGLV